jgi:hypothetical protein
LAILLATPALAPATITTVWQLSDLEKADFLVVGQVLSIEKSERASQESEARHYEVSDDGSLESGSRLPRYMNKVRCPSARYWYSVLGIFFL